MLAFAGGLVVVLLLWFSSASGYGVPGVGHGLRAVVSSPQPGVLLELLVAPFEMVEAGQPVAVVHPWDPRTQLGLLQARLDWVRLRRQPSLAEETALDFERLHAGWLGTRSELAVAQARLHRSQREVERNQRLYEEQLVSQDTYEFLLKTRDMDLAEVQTKSNLVHDVEQRLDALRPRVPPPTPAHDASDDFELARLEAWHQTLATNLTPLTLVSPIQGMVSQVHRQAQEHLVEGEPLVMIQSPWSEYVVGYLRQPYVVDPVVGQQVRVTTRERRSREFRSVIGQIGAQIEPITNVLANVRPGALVDAGLPFLVPLPPGVQVRPGEVVDLHLEDDPEPPAAAKVRPSPTTTALNAPTAHRPLRSP